MQELLVGGTRWMPEKPIKLFASRADRYPEPDGADVVQLAARAALAAIPVFGGPINELLSTILAPAVTRRRDDFFKEFLDDYERLEAKVDGFKAEDLANNESFVSAVIQATRIAVGTHHVEKREMLRNALLNIAAGRCPHEDLQEFYLATVEAFSVSHINVLKFLWTGLADLNRAGIWNAMRPYAIGDHLTAIGHLYPNLKGQEGFLSYLMTDLKNRGFSSVAKPADVFPQNPAITNLGIEFLRFVLEPPKWRNWGQAEF
jgi:hypothetical protein